MKRLSRILIIIAAVVAVAVVIGTWSLNRWLQSPEMHAHVERELSKALKMPLQFQTLRLSLWGGLRAEGVSVQDRGTQFFESSSFTAKHRIFPLLKGRLVFEEIAVDSPKFVLIQRPDGSWKLPELPEEPKAEKKSEEKAAAPKPAGSPKPKKKQPDVLIEKVAITNGHAEFYDKEQKPFATAAGITVIMKDVRGDRMEGRVTADRLTLHGYLSATELSAGVSNTKEKGLIIPQLSAKIGGGTITGGFARKKEKPETRYSAKVKIENVDLASAMIDGGAPPPNLTGQLSASVEVRGTGNDTKKMSGKGAIAFRNGTCREIETINDLGAMFHLDEVANFGIPEAKAELVIWEGRFNVNPLYISAPPLALKATGRADPKKLDLQAELSAAADFLVKHPSLAAQFSPPDANGMRSVGFHVGGSLTKPKHNLMERLTGTKDKRTQKVMAIDAALNSLTQGQRPAAEEGEPVKQPALKQ